MITLSVAVLSTPVVTSPIFKELPKLVPSNFTSDRASKADAPPPPPAIVIVFAEPVPLATTPAPTKSKVVAAVVRALPSSDTVSALPLPPPIPRLVGVILLRTPA